MSRYCYVHCTIKNVDILDLLSAASLLPLFDNGHQSMVFPEYIHPLRRFFSFSNSYTRWSITLMAALNSAVYIFNYTKRRSGLKQYGVVMRFHLA